MTPLIVVALAFVGATALVGMLMFIFLGQSGGKVSERLDTLTGRRKKEDEASSILRKTAFEADRRSLFQMLTPNFPSLQKIFMQADCHIAPSTLFGVGVLLAILGMTASWMAGLIWFVLPVVGGLMFLIPLAWLFNKRRVRLKQFAAQLSDALELVARALRAGHSLAAGMHVVAEEMPSPIAEEFNRVYEEQNLGIPIDDSLKSVCDRVPNLDLRFFVTSVMVQRQTGGKLGEILVTQGLLQTTDVQEILRIRTLDIIYDLFLWQEADFEFCDNEIMPPDLIRIKVEPNAVIMEGIYRVDELTRYRRLIPSDRAILELGTGWTSSLSVGKETRQILYFLEKRRFCASRWSLSRGV